MGWIILAIFFAILILLLSIPFIIKVDWKGSTGIVWSIHLGKILLAPGGAENAREKISLWKRKTAWLGKILKPVWAAIIWLFKAVILIIGFVFKIIIFPFKALVSFFNSRKKDTSGVDFKDNIDDNRELEDQDSDTNSRETDFHSFEEYPESQSYNMESPGEQSTPSTEPDDDFTDSSDMWDSYESSEPFNSASPDTGDEEYGSGRSFETDQIDYTLDIEDEDTGLFKKITGLIDRLKGYYLLYKEYSPLGKRLIKIVFLLMRDYWQALRWRRFKIIVSTGGDPAEMGSASGWYHALDGAFGGKIANHLIFDPDLDDYTFSPRGTLNIELHIVPIFFISPTIRFVSRIPYIKLWKTIKAIRKESNS
ncbi:MAG: hypothetical protein P9L92_11955 [Candidatus Electryonea clarkiae]|nr:hypothetical protein [Candidatus Electryonea clarkiae]MDP8285728.1 hypothetical protein [Candidatus Electryonea clarkiae]